ncbi:MAG: hypothetical protein JXN62_09485 [Bacteroidales bacterium]|nr:hypothetical protein [Bacteroidales bacterium]
MSKDILIFQSTPIVTIATNTFVNVPVILKFEDTNLIEIVKELGIGLTTQIPIYHSDGTYLAKFKGTRSFITQEGRKAGVVIEKRPKLWVGKLGNQIIFEIHHHSGDEFKMIAELFSPEGYFLKCNDIASDLIDFRGNSLNLGGVMMSGNKFIGCNTGIWLKRDGSCTIGLKSG